MPAMKLAIAALLLIVAAAAARAQSHPCVADAIAKAPPLLRFHYGEPNEPVDVANPALFLASEEGRYYTGSIQHPDGGIVMQ